MSWLSAKLYPRSTEETVEERRLRHAACLLAAHPGIAAFFREPEDCLDRHQATAVISGQAQRRRLGMTMVKQFRFAAAPLIAGAVIVITTAAASAFSQQTVSPNGNYNFDYGSLDDKAKLGDSAKTSDPSSQGLHFSVGGGQTDQFGFHNFGGDSNAAPPDHSRPLGNGD